MRELPRLEDAIIRSDAEWFRDNGFISEDMYQRVLAWLDGTDDREIQLTIADWVSRDLKWFYDTEPAFTARFWYLYPAFKAGWYALRSDLIRWERKLRE